MAAFSSSTGGDTLSILIVGKTGSGKSSTGNSLLGEQLFNSSLDFGSVTDTCQVHERTRFGVNMKVTDSPGLFDTKMTQEETATVLMRTVAAMHPGPDVILYVTKVGRYTEEEQGAYERLKSLLDEHVTDHMIVVFSHGDYLHGHEISSMLNTGAPKELKQVLRECGNRYVVIDNTAADNAPQAEQIVSAAKTLKTQNANRPYQCPKYAGVGQKVDDECARRVEEMEKREASRKKYAQELSARMDAATQESLEIQKREQDRREMELQTKEEELRKWEQEMIAKFQVMSQNQTMQAKKNGFWVFPQNKQNDDDEEVDASDEEIDDETVEDNEDGLSDDEDLNSCTSDGEERVEDENEEIIYLQHSDEEEVREAKVYDDCDEIVDDFDDYHDECVDHEDEGGDHLEGRDNEEGVNCEVGEEDVDYQDECSNEDEDNVNNEEENVDDDEEGSVACDEEEEEVGSVDCDEEGGGDYDDDVASNCDEDVDGYEEEGVDVEEEVGAYEEEDDNCIIYDDELSVQEGEQPEEVEEFEYDVDAADENDYCNDNDDISDVSD